MTVTEVRVLEGPNLFFPRPAVKIILGCLSAAQATLRAISRRPGMHVVRGPWGSGLGTESASRHGRWWHMWCT